MVRKLQKKLKNKFNLLSLLIFTFIYISLSAIVVNFYYKEIPFEKQILASYETLGAESEITPALSKKPEIIDELTQPSITAISTEAIDITSDKVLYEKEATTPVYPASTTKIITALVSLDTYYPDQIITVGNVSVEGQKIGLVAGEQISAQSLIYGLLVSSANDAAEVLAAGYPGGREMFVAAMNEKARELGMVNTLFTNPTGLDQEGQLTTCDDLIKASIYAMKIPTFAQIVATKTITIKSIDGKYIHRLTNINRLLGEVDGVKGIKTGYTEGARENLVTYIERDDKKIIIVVLGSQDRFADTKTLISWIFENYVWN